MSELASSSQSVLLKYAILVGMTPLIPLPFLDDMAQSYFERRMIEQLAQAHQLSLTEENLDDLGAPPDPMGCVKGCLVTLLIYPLKKLLRKVFFFLEIKRTIDLISVTYARGHVLDRVLARGLCAPVGPHSPKQVRTAADRALARIGTSPIELALRHTINTSSNLFKVLSLWIFHLLKNLTWRSKKEQVLDAVRTVDEQSSQELSDVEARIEEGLGNVPALHFQKLEAATIEELGPPTTVKP